MKTKKLTRFHAIKILHWCQKAYGRGSINYPQIQFKKATVVNNAYALGEYDYDDNLIYVNSETHSTLLELASTIIHEYCHYRFHSKLQYFSIYEHHEYDKNPLELQANSLANKDKKKCLQYLKKCYNQFN